MTVFQLGAERVVVSSASQYYWFYRKQGVKVEVSPRSHWWCLWQCTTHTEIDLLRCEATLVADGIADHQVQGSCNDCGDLTLWGSVMYEAAVPKKYQTMRYRGNATIAGIAYGFSGVEFFGTPNP